MFDVILIIFNISKLRVHALFCQYSCDITCEECESCPGLGGRISGCEIVSAPVDRLCSLEKKKFYGTLLGMSNYGKN